MIGSPVPTFSVIIPTKGRPSLRHALVSAADQLEPGDELLVICNDAGDFGDSARNSALQRAKGTHLVFLDDDDEYVPGALASMRLFALAHPDRIGLFRMRYWDGCCVWDDRGEFRYGNVSTQNFVIPNVPGKIGRWDSSSFLDVPGGDVQAGDWVFIKETVAMQGDPIFCDQMTVVFCPDRRPWPVRWQARARARLALRSRLHLRRSSARHPHGSIAR
jgi:glycosyltransferase involved in cell wall biosynthesis